MARTIFLMTKRNLRFSDHKETIWVRPFTSIKTAKQHATDDYTTHHPSPNNNKITWTNSTKMLGIEKWESQDLGHYDYIIEEKEINPIVFII